jgi:malonyl-CoA O-methyltransferase
VRFDRHAASYDEHATVQRQMAAALLDRIASAPPPRTLLELGCGTGAFTAGLVTRFPAADVTAIDAAPAMLDEARRRLGSGSTVELMVADAERFDDGRRFDLVVSNATLQWFVDQEACAPHLATLLAPGGATLHATFGPRTFHELFALIAEVEIERGIVPRPRGLPLASASGWEDRLTRAGFVDVTVDEVVVETQYRTCWSFLRAVRAIGASNGTGGGQSAALLGEVARRYDMRHRDGDHVVATYDVVTFGGIWPGTSPSAHGSVGSR